MKAPGAVCIGGFASGAGSGTARPLCPSDISPPRGESPAGVVPPGGGKENVQQLCMTLLFAAFGHSVRSAFPPSVSFFHQHEVHRQRNRGSGKRGLGGENLRGKGECERSELRSSPLGCHPRFRCSAARGSSAFGRNEKLRIPSLSLPSVSFFHQHEVCRKGMRFRKAGLGLSPPVSVFRCAGSLDFSRRICYNNCVLKSE